MIDVKEAASVAHDYLKGLSKDVEFPGLEIEEVELSDDEKFWFITLGYYDDVVRRTRKYKIFKLRTQDGQVLSMKMKTQKEL